MAPGWLPVVSAPYLFWLAGIAASCFSASVSALVVTTGLALSLLLLAALVNSYAAQRRKAVTKLTILVGIVTFFAILLTWIVQPKPRDAIVFALLTGAAVLQAIYILVMLLFLLPTYRRRWRKMIVCVVLLFLACAVLLVVDAIWQLSPLLGSMTVVALTLLLLAFIIWLSSPWGIGALGAALLTLAAALALLGSLVLGELNLATMFLIMFLWTLVIILLCSTFPQTMYLMSRWLLYALSLLLLASALLAGGSILQTWGGDNTEFFPSLFCMLLLIVAGILFILAILTEWGTGSKTYGPVFVCLSGLLTMAAGLVWVVLMIKVLLSAWIITAGCFIFFLGFILFGILKFCRLCCFCCLRLESGDPQVATYQNNV
ncbi:LMP2B [Macacine gammaherpesvirus 4]|nr:LMP2B [Macacine gammaherpesvirus 4]AAK95410.1 LMP2B [Macacine gammaherpesvirus 4]